MPEFEPRITATEKEYPIVLQREAGQTYEQVGTKGYGLTTEVIAHRNKALPRSSMHFLGNGSRLYPDTGDHVEYAGAEFRSFKATVAGEIGGDEIVCEATDAYCESEDEDGQRRFSDGHVNNRVVDQNFVKGQDQNTWGYHINLSSPVRNLPTQDGYAQVMGAHLATQNVYGGAGAVIKDEGGHMRFCIGQKVLNLTMDTNVSSHVTGNQPLISTRDEPHSSSEHSRSRIHITSMDATMSPWATWMKFATTSLVLRLIEDGYQGYDLSTQLPKFEIARRVAHDHELKEVYELTDGRTFTAIDMQWMLFERVHAYAQNHELPDEEVEGLAEWERALSDLGIDPLLLLDRSDWVSKMVILNEYMDRHDTWLGDKEVLDRDRQWDLLKAEGYGMIRRQKRWKKWMPERELIDWLKVMPPEDTRAKIRGDFVRRTAQLALKKIPVQTDWNLLGIAGEVKSLKNPYAYQNEEVEALLKQHGI